MGRVVKMNYDDLRTIIKKFRDEGEDIVQLHAAMRDKVRDLHKDWEGESSEKFFKEMENEVLPAVSRLSKALFFAQDTLQKITKIIQDSDEDTKGFFKGDFTRMSRESTGALGVAAAVNSWERMNQLGVWDANRKEFVYPDNQLQPELRRCRRRTRWTSGSSGFCRSAGGCQCVYRRGQYGGRDGGNNSGSVTPHSSDEKKSNDEKGFLPEVTTVEADR